MTIPLAPALERLRERYPEKFAPEPEIFGHVRRGDRIFIGTACSEPQHLVRSLTGFVSANPTALFDAEVVQVWTMGVAPYTDERLKYNFRHNSFFVGAPTRGAVNSGLADYTPIFLSQVPALFDRRVIYTKEMVILAVVPDGARELVITVAEYYVEEDGLTANVAFAVRDRYQNQGVGTVLLQHLSQIARKQGLIGFTAEVLRENEPMLRVFEKMRCPIQTERRGDCYDLEISLR